MEEAKKYYTSLKGVVKPNSFKANWGFMIGHGFEQYNLQVWPAIGFLESSVDIRAAHLGIIDAPHCKISGLHVDIPLLIDSEFVDKLQNNRMSREYVADYVKDFSNYQFENSHVVAIQNCKNEFHELIDSHRDKTQVDGDLVRAVLKGKATLTDVVMNVAGECFYAGSTLKQPLQFNDRQITLRPEKRADGTKLLCVDTDRGTFREVISNNEYRALLMGAFDPEPFLNKYVGEMLNLKGAYDKYILPIPVSSENIMIDSNKEGIFLSVANGSMKSQPIKLPKHDFYALRDGLCTKNQLVEKHLNDNILDVIQFKGARPQSFSRSMSY